MNTTIIGRTRFSTGNSIEKPMRLVLKIENNKFVSRFQTNDEIEFYGHYSRGSLDEAKERFEHRVKYHNDNYKEGDVSHLGNIVWCNLEESDK